MLEVKRATIIAIVLVLALGVLPRHAAYASSGCSIAVTPTIISPGTEAVLQFDIQNTGSDPVAWIQIQRPTLSYSVNGITQSGWTDATDENGTTLTDGTIAPGGSYSVQLAVFTAPQEEGASDWIIRLAPSIDGSDMFTCDGSSATTIGTPPAPPSPNGESNIGLTNIAPTTATIGWTSDAASTSYVYYGKSDSYGSVATTPGSSSDHSVVLNDLSPSTIYHYMVAGSDASANNFFSGDNTFITPAAPSPPLQPIIINNTVTGPGSGAQAVPKVPGDATPPTVSLDTPPSRPYATAPLLRGSAADNGALAHIQYSVDGGRNWLPVDSVSGIGGKSATFSFTPAVQDDGNYPIVVSATDSNGNEAHTTPVTLVIDRLPPQIGPLVVSYGPEVLTPDAGGALDLLAGTSYHLSASAIGGATTVTIEARPQEQLSPTPVSFSLTQSAESGLWAGLLTFQKGGIYQLVARSLDGAGNRTVRPIATVAVTPAGRVLEAGTGHALRGAKLTLYFFEPSTSTWQVWDGAPYGQSNPQTSTRSGGYSLTVPAGKYYLQVTSSGHRPFTSDSFEVASPLALASTLRLGAIPHLKLGPLTFYRPELQWRSQALPAPDQKPIAGVQPLTGLILPAFNLPTTTGGHKRNIELEGRPTDLVMLTTWSPGSASQLSALAAAQTNPDVNITPVFSQEHTSLVTTYLATAGYSLTGLIDPDGLLVPPLRVGSMPEHIFVDRSGRIKKVMVGVLSKDQILESLGGL